MKRLVGMRRLALAGSALFSAQVASCSLDQSSLDSLLASLGSFQGSVNIHVNQNAGSHSGGGSHEDGDDEQEGGDDQEDQSDSDSGGSDGASPDDTAK
ncbi:MAG: hypothetical protein HZB38_14490 [Planctomycetes bacterium]|nr:hypothetical protein [Planctomycetota bacterium]